MSVGSDVIAFAAHVQPFSNATRCWGEARWVGDRNAAFLRLLPAVLF